MSAGHDIETACRKLGIDFHVDHDRTHPGHALHMEVEWSVPTLRLVLGSEPRVTTTLVDLDLDRGGLLLEVAVRSPRREPTFDLWLDEERRERHLVIRRDGGWSLEPVDLAVATVIEATDCRGGDALAD